MASDSDKVQPPPGGTSGFDLSERARAWLGRPSSDPQQRRREEVMAFALDIDGLNTAVDVLTFCQTKRPWSALLNEFRYERELRHFHGFHCEPGIALGKISDVVQFLTGQGLLIRLKPVRRNDGYSESVLKAIPKAVTELIYRLAHNGEPSTPAKPQPSFEEQRQEARDKVNEALLAAGYHTTDKGRRLRVVR